MNQTDLALRNHDLSDLFSKATKTSYGTHYAGRRTRTASERRSLKISFLSNSPTVTPPPNPLEWDKAAI